MTQPDITQELVQRAREGDQGAVEQLFASHRAYLRRVIDLRLGAELARRVDISDVVQDAQFRAIQRLSTFLKQDNIEFRPWLRSQALDRITELRRLHLGSAKRAMHRETRLSGCSSAMLVSQLFGDTPSNIVIRQEAIAAVQQAVKRLRAQDRELLLLRHFEGLTNYEAAQVLGIEPAAASKRFGRVLLKLHQELVLSGVGLTGDQRGP